MYRDGELLSIPSELLWCHASGYASLVEVRVRLLTYSSKLDRWYFTALPTFTNFGPSPRKRAFASQERLTASVAAASAAESKVSKESVLFWVFISMSPGG